MSWLKDCEICNAGLCKAVDERKSKGMREHAACAEMSKESNALYSTKQILDRYRYHTGKDKRVSEIPKEKVAKNDLVVSRRGDQLLSQTIPENHEDRKINPEHEKEGQQLLEKLENLIKEISSRKSPWDISIDLKNKLLNRFSALVFANAAVIYGIPLQSIEITNNNTGSLIRFLDSGELSITPLEKKKRKGL